MSKLNLLKEFKNTLVDILSRLIDFELMEPNLAEREGYEYTYAMF